LSADKIWILPSADGTAGQFLKTDGAGNLSFDSLSFSTPLAVIGNATSGSEIRLPEDTDNGSNYVAIKAPDTIASNLTLTLPSADGTSGQVLQTNGSGVLSFSSPSADFVLLATTTASASASVTFDGYFSSTYDNYIIYAYDVYPATNNVEWRMRFRRSNSDVTASNYAQSVLNHQTGGYDGQVTTGASSFNVFFGGNVGNTSTDNNCRVITIFNPLSTTTHKAMNYYGWGKRYDGNIFTTSSSGQLSDDTTALSGVSFFMTSGNLTGKFKIYGIK
jgi:hypothetical protein